MSASPDDTDRTGDPAKQRRAFVLIPGAGGAAWYWHLVVPLLREAGHEAIAVDLPADDPAAGLPEYADLVIRAIGNRRCPVAAAEQGGYSTEIDLGGYFLHDVPADVAAAGEPYQRPEADVAFGSVCDFSAWPPVPIRAVAGSDDRFFPVGFQQALARDRLGINADVLPGGHLISLSQPARLAGFLLGVDA